MKRLFAGAEIFTVMMIWIIVPLHGRSAGQAPPAGDVVIGSGNFSPIVADLDKSIAFYNDLLGVNAPAAAGPTPFGADSALLNFLGVPTAQIRFSTVRIPGSAMG